MHILFLFLDLFEQLINLFLLLLNDHGLQMFQLLSKLCFMSLSLFLQGGQGQALRFHRPSHEFDSFFQHFMSGNPSRIVHGHDTHTATTVIIGVADASLFLLMILHMRLELSVQKVEFVVVFGHLFLHLMNPFHEKDIVVGIGIVAVVGFVLVGRQERLKGLNAATARGGSNHASRSMMTGPTAAATRRGCEQGVIVIVNVVVFVVLTFPVIGRCCTPVRSTAIRIRTSRTRNANDGIQTTAPSRNGMLRCEQTGQLQTGAAVLQIGIARIAPRQGIE